MTTEAPGFYKVLNTEDRGEKKAGYFNIATSGYPLLYAFCMDLNRYTTDERFRKKNGFSTVKCVPGGKNILTTIDVSKKKQKIEVALDKTGIAYTKAAHKEFMMFSYYGNKHVPSSQNTFSGFIAATPEDLELFQKGLFALAEPLGHIPRADSLVQQVENQLEASNPDVNKAYISQRAVESVINGFLATYVAGTFLSQRPILGADDIPTRDRLIRVLRSDVVNKFTKKVHLGLQLSLAYVGIIPDNLLIEQPGGELDIHPDLDSFIDVLNGTVAIPVNHPMLCPFAVPLGEQRAAVTIEEQYDGNLPAEVAQMVRANARIPGITTAGQSMADYLARVI